MVQQAFTLTQVSMAIYAGGDGKSLILDESSDLPHKSSDVAGWLHNANSASSYVAYHVKDQAELWRR